MADYDFLIIGAGTSGMAAAKRAAEYGAKVGVIEKEKVGGTCLNRGCTPKKTHGIRCGLCLTGISSN